MSKIKIFNDPIYGLVNYPYEFIYDLIDHPYFQRLRRIQQLGMSSLVYPGATHTRFHHALGALHLCDRLITNLRLKGIQISDHEYQAVLIATLLHDIGHGPYSHSLEGKFIKLNHEEITLKIMDLLNIEYEGSLTLAISMFKKEYHRPFLSQIISGQMDVDRLDYLNRDSFYTGVAEGIIGYDRIIKMMNVVDDQLVIEEKGIYSVEQFLLSRQFMYHQVYQHHAALAADHMLKIFFKYYKSNVLNLEKKNQSNIEILLNTKDISNDHQLQLFLQIDDSDIMMMIKSCLQSNSWVLNTLANGLINRKIFGIKTQGKPFDNKEREDLILQNSQKLKIDIEEYQKLVNVGFERNDMYSREEEIKILRKEGGQIVTFGEISRLNFYSSDKEVFFMTYPK